MKTTLLNVSRTQSSHFSALWTLFLLLITNCKAQSNYNDQAISISYEGEGLPNFGVLNGTVTELDTIPPSINLNRTEANLGCADGAMIVNLKFKRSFYGIVYADNDRNSACKMTGNGNITGTITLPLKGCGTLQSPLRVFTNNILVRFHPGLEIEGDEVITIICRYPPPLAPVPIVPVPLAAPITPVKALQPLREFEILLIICAIIFLALLLLGIGCSYYCLKKRNIKVVHRRSASTLGSEVTKISDPMSLFGGLKIPRAHATDTSGSEELTESIHSNFPSEMASVISEEEYHSNYSDQGCEIAEGTLLAQLRDPGVPGFDVRTIVKNGRGFSPLSSRASSESGLILKAQEQYLTTILERTETNTLETLERIRRVEEKKKNVGPPPVHARIRVHQRQVSDLSETESEFSQGQMSDYYEQDMFLSSKDTQNLIMDQKNEFDVSIKTKYENPNFSHSDEDSASTIFSEPLNVSTHYSSSRNVYNKERKNNFDVLIRILDPSPSETGTHPWDDDLSSVFTDDERIRLREVILQDVHVRQMIQTATTTEEFAIIRNHQSLQKVIEPRKWDVLIRVLQNPIYDEEDDDDMSDKASTTVTGYSTYPSGHDVRSMSEMMVDDFSTNISHISRNIPGNISQMRIVSSESTRNRPDPSNPREIADALIRYVTTTDHDNMEKPGYISDLKSIKTTYSSSGTHFTPESRFSGNQYRMSEASGGQFQNEPVSSSNRYESLEETYVTNSSHPISSMNMRSDLSSFLEKPDAEVISTISGRSGYTQGGRSMADRSATEITEYHHFTSKSERSMDDFDN